MKALQTKLPRLSIAATLVASAIAFGVNANTNQLVESATLAVDSTERYRTTKDRNAVRVEFPTYYIVELSDPAAVRYQGGIAELAGTSRRVTSKDRFDAQSPAVQEYVNYLRGRHEQFASVLQARVPGASIETTTTNVLNAVVVAHTGTDIKAQLRSLPGVKNVYENETFYLNMDASNDLINSPAAWELLGGRDDAGAGVKVAILDSGILSDHPMFQSNGHSRPEGVPETDYCGTVDATFCNDKLVLARVYEPRIAISELEVTDRPYDINGHGSHVAGTAVGNQVAANFQGVDLNFSGVAPGAALYVYKSFYLTPEGRGSASGISILEALEDMVEDGVDVINNSWGGGVGADPATSAYTPVWANIEEAGIINVTSAGNSGPGAQTLGCPACAEPGLAVASTETGRTFAMLVDGPGLEDEPALPGSDTSITEAITAPLMPAMAIDAENPLACEPFPEGSFAGHIGVVSRGECDFSLKATNFQNAGATAMLLYNNTAGTISMSMPGSTLPSVSITQAAGEALLAAWEEGDTATINPPQAIINPDRIDIMSGFSSRGPNADRSFLKPDIAAPGTAILSAYPVNGEWGYGAINGTSMAGPHVAGAAALLRQLRPDIDAIQAKSILMTSANPNVRKDNGIDAATNFDMGAGRLDLAAAFNTAITLDKASFSHPQCMAECLFTREITNISGEDTEWTATVEFLNEGVYGSVDFENLELAADGTASFTLTIDSRFAGDGWQHGRVIISDVSGTYADAVLPIAVQTSRSDNASVISTGGEAANIVGSEPTRFSTQLNDDNFSGEVTLSISNSENVVIDEDSVTVETNLATGEFVIAEDGSMSWVGTLDSVPPVAELNVDPAFPYTGLSVNTLGLGNSLGCIATSCDEVRTTLNIGNPETGYGFFFNGEAVSSVSISDNGFITMGMQDHSGTWMNSLLPDVTPPNAILAPFWTDIDAGGPAGGDIQYATVVNNATGQRFLVVEWVNVPEYASAYDGTEERYSFSIWIEAGTSNIHYQYLDLGAALPQFLTVGYEDVTGTIGTTTYFDGQGVAPVVGETRSAALVPGDTASVNISYDVTARVFGEAEATTAETVENESINIDLAEVYTTSISGLTDVSVVSEDVEYRAINPFTLNGTGDYRVEIVSYPENGSAWVDSNTLTALYVPNAGFYGEDSFDFRIVDSTGTGTTVATATVAVAQANRAPEAAASGPASARFNEDVELSAAASSDPDGDSLTYSWRQIGGIAVSLSNASSATASFTAPAVVPATILTFEVTVSDGELSDTATVSVEIQRKPASDKWYEGSFGAFIALIALPLAIIRRRRRV